MKNYSLVLKFEKLTLPNTDKETIINTIRTHRFTVDYFGNELDNQADYIDDDMQAEFDKSSYMNFFIQSSSKKLDFDNDSEAYIFNELIEIILESKSFKVTQDGNNFDVYCG